MAGGKNENGHVGEKNETKNEKKTLKNGVKTA